MVPSHIVSFNFFRFGCKEMFFSRSVTSDVARKWHALVEIMKIARRTNREGIFILLLSEICSIVALLYRAWNLDK